MVKLRAIFEILYLLFRIVLVDAWISIFGFNKTFQYYKNKNKFLKKDMDLDYFFEKSKEIEELYLKLEYTCAWYPKKADCIHKTLIGYDLIRKRYSIPVDMVVGVNKFPFEAHAWLQLYGKDFFDQSDETSKYKVVLSSSRES